MQGCLAPSEIPGVSSSEASVFGSIAEEIIFADFCAQNPATTGRVFQDNNNPSAYLYFLASNNPQFTPALQRDYYRRLIGERLMRIPDILVHAVEKAFYEIKPDSVAGMKAGINKVGTLRAVYSFYRLPYVAGSRFRPRDHLLAYVGTAIRATLRVRRVASGLIVYRLCLKVDGVLELATLAVLLRHIVLEVNRQRGQRTFRPVDLSPVFQNQQQLRDLARRLGLTMAAAATGVAAAVGWKHFWKAVVARFALRGGTAAALAAADGPLPVGDLVAAGLALWTVIDIIRLSDELWRDAEELARQGA